MFSSGKEVFIFGSGFSLCVQLLECSGNTLVTQNSIAWYCSSLCSHFLIPVIPQECSTEPMLGPHQILNLKFPNKRRKHLRKTTFQISSTFLKHNFSSKLFKLKGGTSEQSELLQARFWSFWRAAQCHRGGTWSSTSQYHRRYLEVSKTHQANTQTLFYHFIIIECVLFRVWGVFPAPPAACRMLPNQKDFYLTASTERNDK